MSFPTHREENKLSDNHPFYPMYKKKKKGSKDECTFKCERFSGGELKNAPVRACIKSMELDARALMFLDAIFFE